MIDIYAHKLHCDSKNGTLLFIYIFMNSQLNKMQIKYKVRNTMHKSKHDN